MRVEDAQAGAAQDVGHLRLGYRRLGDHHEVVEHHDEEEGAAAKVRRSLTTLRAARTESEDLLFYVLSHPKKRSETWPWERVPVGRSFTSASVPTLPTDLVPGSTPVSNEFDSRFLSEFSCFKSIETFLLSFPSSPQLAHPSLLGHTEATRYNKTNKGRVSLRVSEAAVEGPEGRLRITSLLKVSGGLHKAPTPLRLLRWSVNSFKPLLSLFCQNKRCNRLVCVPLTEQLSNPPLLARSSVCSEHHELQRRRHHRSVTLRKIPASHVVFFRSENLTPSLACSPRVPIVFLGLQGHPPPPTRARKICRHNP